MRIQRVPGMTVKALIETLEQLPAEAEVWLDANGGEYVGPLRPDDIRLVRDYVEISL